MIMRNTQFEKRTNGRNHALYTKRTLEVYMRFIYVILLYWRNTAGDQRFLVFATQQNGTSDIYARQLRSFPLPR